MDIQGPVRAECSRERHCGWDRWALPDLFELFGLFPKHLILEHRNCSGLAA